MSDLWQHPFVDVFKTFGVDTVGDCTEISDKEINKKVYRIHGNVGPRHFVQSPKIRHKALGLTGEFIYLQVKALPQRYFSIHLDFQVQQNNFRLTLTTLHKTAKLHPKSLLYPIDVGSSWSVICVDVPTVIKYAGFNVVSGTCKLKSVQVCASVIVRAVFTSDQRYLLDTFPRELKLSYKNVTVRWFDVPSAEFLCQKQIGIAATRTQVIEPTPPPADSAIPDTPMVNALTPDGSPGTDLSPILHASTGTLGASALSAKDETTPKFFIKDPLLSIQHHVGKGHGVGAKWLHSDLLYVSSATIIHLNVGSGTRQTALRLATQIKLLQVSPDYSRVATVEAGRSDITCRLWKNMNGTLGACTILPLKGMIDVLTCDFDARGRHICFTVVDQQKRHTVSVWEIRKTECFLVARQVAHAHVEALHFGPHDLHLVSCGQYNIRFWRAKDGCLPSQSVPLNNYRQMHFLCFAFEHLHALHDRQRIFVGNTSGQVASIDCEDRKLLNVYNVHSGPVRAIRACEAFVITVSDDAYIRVIPLDFSPCLIQVLDDAPIFSLDLAFDGARACITNKDGTVAVLDTTTHDFSVVSRSVSSDILCADASVNFQELASIHKDGSIKVWNVPTMTQSLDFDTNGATPLCITFHPEKYCMAVGFKDGQFCIFDNELAEVDKQYHHHRNPIIALKFARDNRRGRMMLLTCDSTGQMQLLEEELGFKALSFPEVPRCSEPPEHCPVFHLSRNYQWLARYFDRRTIMLVEFPDMTLCTHRIRVAHDLANFITSYDCKSLVVGSVDHKLRIYSIADGVLCHEVHYQQGPVRALAMTGFEVYDYSLLFVACEDKMINVSVLRKEDENEKRHIFKREEQQFSAHSNMPYSFFITDVLVSIAQSEFVTWRVDGDYFHEMFFKSAPVPYLPPSSADCEDAEPGKSNFVIHIPRPEHCRKEGSESQVTPRKSGATWLESVPLTGTPSLQEQQQSRHDHDDGAELENTHKLAFCSLSHSSAPTTQRGVVGYRGEPSPTPVSPSAPLSLQNATAEEFVITPVSSVTPLPYANGTGKELSATAVIPVNPLPLNNISSREPSAALASTIAIPSLNSVSVAEPSPIVASSTAPLSLNIVTGKEPPATPVSAITLPSLNGVTAVEASNTQPPSVAKLSCNSVTVAKPSATEAPSIAPPSFNGATAVEPSGTIESFVAPSSDGTSPGTKQPRSDNSLSPISEGKGNSATNEWDALSAKPREEHSPRTPTDHHGTRSVTQVDNCFMSPSLSRKTRRCDDDVLGIDSLPSTIKPCESAARTQLHDARPNASAPAPLSGTHQWTLHRVLGTSKGSLLARINESAVAHAVHSWIHLDIDGDELIISLPGCVVGLAANDNVLAAIFESTHRGPKELGLRVWLIGSDEDRGAVRILYTRLLPSPYTRSSTRIVMGFVGTRVITTVDVRLDVWSDTGFMVSSEVHSPVRCMVSCGDSEFVTMMECDGMLWRIQSNMHLQYQLLDAPHYHRGNVGVDSAFTCVTFDGTRILCGTSMGCVVAYDFHSNELDCEFPIEEGTPIDQIYCASWPDKIMVCVRNTLRCGHVIKKGTGSGIMFLPYDGLCTSFDGRCLHARFSSDAVIIGTEGNSIWKIPYGQKRRRLFNFHAKKVTCMAAQSGVADPLCATGGDDGVVNLWGMSAFGLGTVAQLRGSSPCKSMCFLVTIPKVLVVAFADPYFRIFDTKCMTPMIKTMVAEEVTHMTAAHNLNSVLCCNEFGELTQVKLRLERDRGVVDGFRSPIVGPNPRVSPTSCSSTPLHFLFTFSKGEVWIWKSTSSPKLVTIWALPHPQKIGGGKAEIAYHAEFVDSHLVIGVADCTAYVYDFARTQLLSRISIPGPAIQLHRLGSPHVYVVYDSSIGFFDVNDEGSTINFEIVASGVSPKLATIHAFRIIDPDSHIMVLFQCGLTSWRTGRHYAS